MQAKPNRRVLGFYSTDETDRAKAYEAVRHLAHHVCVFESGSGLASNPEDCSRDSALCLDGEYLIVADAPLDRVQNIVLKLREVGSPSVFVVADDSAWRAGALEEPPPRSEEPLAELARKLAEARGKPYPTRNRILARVRESETILRAARRDLLGAARLDHALAAAAEWLLDNAYLIRTQVAEIIRHWPREHHKILPAAPSGNPYIYDLAVRLVEHTDCTVNEANIEEVLRAYQTVAPLTIAELWSFSLVVRMALVEALADLA